MEQGIKTKNTVIIILSVILAAALISGSILYWSHLKTKDALQVSEEKLLDMKEDIIPSKDAQIDELQKKLKIIQTDVLNLEDRSATEQAKLRELQEKYDLIFSQLDEMKIALDLKDNQISQLHEKLEVLESEYEKEKKMNKSLRSGLTSKDSVLASLENEIGEKQSNILSLEEETRKNRKEIERLQSQLLDITGEKDMTESEMGQLRSTYEQLVSDLQTQIENHEVDIRAYKENISVTFVDSILFDSGKASMSEEGRMVLRKVGELLRDVKGRNVRIIGHTDDIPIMKAYRYKFPTNWELSTARASAVVRYFQKEIGLDPSDLEAVGRSSYQPIASNETAQGRAQNRRVNIIIGPKVR